ncbi:MAG TPA: hypothetical protein VMV49_05995 [Candidatus Deferrimicrobium sp.]|nr:hypothetical protein [Candidatus Deferrimicrobium sp.]
MNWKKFFFIVGIPLLTFYIFLIVIFYAFISTLLLLTLLLGLCCCRFSKKKIFPGLSKLAVAMLIFFTLLIPNITYWPTQIARHLDTSLVIQPNDALVQQLNATDHLWTYLNVTPSYFYNNMTDDERLQNMTDYILDEVIEYHFINEVYGVTDYTSSAHEAIVHGKGDCHSRTIVMVSFFIYMGYDAWACETPFHWYTCVFLGSNRTDPHYYYRDVFRDGLNWTDPQIMFNNEEKFFTMNVFERLGDVVFGLPFYDKIYELFSITEMPFVLWPLLVGIGLMMSIAIRGTVSEKKYYLKNGIFASLVLIAGFFFGIKFSGFFFPQVVFLTLLLSVVLAAQSVHSNLGYRFFTKDKDD